MYFEEDFVEKVRSSSDIVELIGQYTRLKNSGRNLMGVCPFPSHAEKTPSFSVSQEKQLYHCFGCGKSGNIFSFLRDQQGLSFPESVEYLAKRASISLPQKQDYKPKKKGDIDVKDLNAFCRDLYVEHLKSLSKDHPAVKYLEARGFDKELQNIFQIGYAPDMWDFVSKKLKAKSYTYKQISELGLFKSKDGQSYYDVFRNRIIFPIISPTTEILGFGGRVLDDSKPKYLNSPETSAFKKSRTFYGLHETAKEIRQDDFVIVVEGYTDLIALYKKGFKNVVATLGTALTEDHAKVLKRYTTNVVTLFDGDQAGIGASEKAMRHLLNHGLLVKGVYLPTGEDPDSYLNKYGEDSLRAEISSAKDLYIIFLDRIMKTQSVDQASDKLKVGQKLAEVLGLITLDSLKNLYIQETAFRLNVSPQWVVGLIKEGATSNRPRASNANVSKPGNVQNSVESVDSRYPQNSNSKYKGLSAQNDHLNSKIRLKNDNRFEKDFINLLLMDSQCLDYAIENVDLALLEGSQILPLYEKILAIYRQKATDFDKLTALLINLVEPQNYLTGHLLKPLSELDEEQRLAMLKDYILRLKQLHQRKKLKQITSLISSDSSFQDLEQIVNIKKSQLGSKES